MLDYIFSLVKWIDQVLKKDNQFVGLDPWNKWKTDALVQFRRDTAGFRVIKPRGVLIVLLTDDVSNL